MAKRFLDMVCLVSAIWSVRIVISDDFKTALAKQSQVDLPSFLALKPSSLSRPPPARHQQQQLSPIQWRSLIEQLLEVRCSPRQMTVLLHYSNRRLAPKSVEETLRNGRMYTEVNGSTVTACGAIEATSLNGDDDAMVLKLGYDDCGVHAYMGNDTVVYKTVVIVEANASVPLSQGQDQWLISVRQSYTVQCVHPLSLQAPDPPKFSFALSGGRFSESWTYPHTMDTKSHVFLSSNVSSSWQKYQEVYSYPIDCWSSPAVSGSARTARKKYFMRNGCADHKLANIHHFTNGPTKVSIQGSALVFDDVDDDSSSALSSTPTTDRSQDIRISCDVIPCTHGSTTGILDIPKCPPSYFCSGKSGAGNNLLPARLRGVKRTTVVAGPVTVTVTERKEAEATATTVDCALACSRTEPTVRRRVQSAPQPMAATEQVEGVSLRTAMIIAFASFVFGILFMSALWWVHVRTDPKRLKILQQHWRNVPTDTRMRTTTFTTSTESSMSPRYQVKSRLHDSGCHSTDSSSHHIRESISPIVLASTSAKSTSVAIEESRDDAATARLLLNTAQ